MRFVLRFLSLLSLAAAVIVGVVDSIQSVAGETVAFTPFGAAVFSISPQMFAASEAYFQAHISTYLWDTVMEWLLQQPAVAVFLSLSLILYAIAYKREPAGSLAIRSH